MSDIFLFGTLRHVPLLEIVVGADQDLPGLQPDTLHSVRAVQSENGAALGLQAQDDAETVGNVCSHISAEALARLTFYISVLGCSAQPAKLSDGTAVTVFSDDAGQATETPFDFEHWQERWSAVTCEAAHAVMAQFGVVSAEDIANQYPRELVRAQSRLNAKHSRHGQDTLRGQVKTLHRRRAYSHFYALDEVTLQHETFSGEISAPIDRGVFVTTDAALVLPYDPNTDRVLTVEQFRVGPLTRGDRTVWQMEPVAGLIDPSETPENTAVREAMEEAGVVIRQLEPVAQGYTSPGGSTDFSYLYIGLCDLPEVGTRIGGLEEEGEDIRAHVMPFEKLMTMAEDQRLANVPLGLATYWLAFHRARLRSA